MTVLGATAAVLVVGVGATVLAVTRSEEADEKTKHLLLLTEYSISGNLAVGAGDVEFAVANGGDVAHTLGVRNGPITALLTPGQASKLELLDLAPGTYELYRSLHEDRGMVSTLQVVAADAGSDPAAPD